MVSKPWTVPGPMLCDNNCDLPAGGDCHGCRKRKEHEDDYEVDMECCKYSKQSPSENDSVSFLMRKWSNSELDCEVPSVTTPPVLDEKPISDPGSSPSFSWMAQRPRHDSFKENRDHEENNNQFTTKGRFTISDSMSFSEKHKATLPTRSSGRKSKSKQLSKKLSALQSKIETEAEVIQMKMGYRPSHADKMKCEQIIDLVQEQEKIKLELKDLSEDSPKKKTINRSLEKERDAIIRNLADLRLSVGRPYEIADMTVDQIADERQDMQTALNEFEKKYNVPLTKRDKETMSGLYERYRCVKRLCRRQSCDLVPIPEHTSIDLTLATPRERISSVSLDSEPAVEDEQEDFTSRIRVLRSMSDDEKWHQMTFPELNDTLAKLKESKKVYKRQINEVEGATTNIETDQSMSDIYVHYKATKYKIKLIKALIDKQTK